MSEHGPADGGRAVAVAARVVVVDDEPGVVDIFTQYLNLMGWHAIGFTNGQSALELLRSQGQHLLVTDLIMPGINGLQLAQAAKSAQPGLKVLLVSGVDPKRWPDGGQDSMEKVDAFLAKPTPLEELSQCCQRLLAEA